MVSSPLGREKHRFLKNRSIFQLAWECRKDMFSRMRSKGSFLSGGVWGKVGSPFWAWYCVLRERIWRGVSMEGDRCCKYFFWDVGFGSVITVITLAEVERLGRSTVWRAFRLGSGWWCFWARCWMSPWHWNLRCRVLRGSRVFGRSLSSNDDFGGCEPEMLSTKCRNHSERVARWKFC